MNDFIYKQLVGVRELLHPNGVRKTVNNIPCRFTARYAKGIPTTIPIQMLDRFLDLAKTSNVVLELGGHIGTWTELIGNVMPPNGKIYVFEPHPESFKILRKQAKVSLSKNKIILVNKAVGEAEGNLKFEMYPDNPRALDNSAKSKLVGDGNAGFGGKIISVPVITVDLYCKENNCSPNLVKIDIEGAELPALKGMKHILETGKTKIIIELHQFAWQGFGYTPDDVIDFVSNFPKYKLVDPAGNIIDKSNSGFRDNMKIGHAELLPIND